MSPTSRESGVRDLRRNAPIFAALGDATRLKLTHTGIERFPKTPAYARKNFEAGWTAIIGSELKQFLEGKQKVKS